MRRAPVTVATPERDLTAATWDELAAMSADADPAVSAAAFAEGQRRDLEELRRERMAAARKGYEALRAEWYDAAHAQYLQAETYCGGGSMLSALGKRKTSEPMTLWTGSEEQARRWASEDLLEFWDYHCARLSFGTWLRQRARGLRAQRDDLDAIGSNSVRNEAHPATGDASPASSSIPPEQAKRHGNEGMNVDAADTETPAGAGAREAWEGSDHYRRKAEQRQADTASIRRERSQAGRVQVATPTAVIARRDAGTVATQVPQIDGAALLSYVRAFITKYTYLTPAQADAVTLWIGHSHARDEAGYLAWAASPRLYALSSKPGSGKSTLLEHLGRLCPATFGLDTEPTEAGLVYTISREHATVLLDEGDVLFASGRRKSAVRAVINSGYTPNGTTLKIKNGKGERVRIYGALALAALDVVEKATGGTMEATLSRGVAMRMVQAPEGHEIPEMTRTDDMNAAKLKLVLEKWGTAGRDEMAGLDVDVPEGIRNRQAQIWKTLLRVGAFADLSHKRARNDPDSVPPGGSWYDRAWDACEALALAGADDDADRTAELMDELGATFGGLDGEI